ncbi:hypothetical protein RUND412_004658 [Rhizina undulata]
MLRPRASPTPVKGPAIGTLILEWTRLSDHARAGSLRCANLALRGKQSGTYLWSYMLCLPDDRRTIHGSGLNKYRLGNPAIGVGRTDSLYQGVLCIFFVSDFQDTSVSNYMGRPTCFIIGGNPIIGGEVSEYTQYGLDLAPFTTTIYNSTVISGIEPCYHACKSTEYEKHRKWVIKRVEPHREAFQSMI